MVSVSSQSGRTAAVESAAETADSGSTSENAELSEVVPEVSVSDAVVFSNAVASAETDAAEESAETVELLPQPASREAVSAVPKIRAAIR